MFIQAKNQKTTVRERMRDGSGKVSIRHVVDKENLPENSRLCAVMTLEEGCSIGPHDHTNETEIYYCLEGEGVLDDNGETRPFLPGDVNICGGGSYHAVKNAGEKPLRVLAVIILE